MADDLPNDVFKYIQEEETIGTGPVSESVAQKMGGDNNYLKATLDQLQAAVDEYLASSPGTGPMSVVPLYASGGATQGSPNGKQWLLAFMMPIRVAPETPVGPASQSRPIAPTFTTYYFWSESGPFGPVNFTATAVFSGTNSENISFGGWNGTGKDWVGFGLYET